MLERVLRGASNVLRRLTFVLGGFFCLTTAAAFLGTWGWIFELVTHFRLQYAVVLLLLAAGMIAMRRFRAAVVFLIFALVNLLVLAPYVFARRDATPVGHAKPVRFLALNVFARNERYALVRALLTREQPDIVVLTEVTPRWLQELHPVRDADYPYAVERAHGGTSGIALWSRFPLKNARIQQIGGGLPSAVADLQIREKTIVILGTHPAPPHRPRWARRRNQHFRALPEFLAERRKEGASVVLLGDMNITPWSPYFQRLLNDADLTDSARGYGIQPTWPTIVWYMRIPVDHCLLSTDLRAVRRQIGPNIGSDHFPLLVDVVVGPAE